MKLIIARVDAIPPPVVTPRTEVWRDHDGVICAYGDVRGDEYWIHLPRFASFRFSSRADDITAVVPTGISDELVIDAYHRCVLPMTLQVGGREVLHASAIRTEQGVLALCGVSETGKSTIAFGLSRRGYGLWADDAVVFETSAYEATVISLPFEIRLRPHAAELFELAAPPRVNAASRDAVLPGLNACRLLGVCVLRRVEAATSAIVIRRLSSAEAFGAVLSHAYCFTLQDKERKGRMIRHYLDLVAQVSIFDVCFRSGLATMPAILDAIGHLARSECLRKMSSGWSRRSEDA